MRITTVWIVIVSLHKMCSAQNNNPHNMEPFILVQTGESVHLKCPLEEKNMNSIIVWYKQDSGQMPQEVGTSAQLMDAIILSPFKESGLKLDRIKNMVSLIIPSVTKADAATYFCGVSQVNTIKFISSTFLSVTGRPHLGVNISVQQSPDLVWVGAGESVSVQCSVVSESRAAELRVLWLRAAVGESHPEIIYTYHNSNRHCEIGSSTQRCVYNLSKDIYNLQQTHTYYCAVATCGRIIIGNGTSVILNNSVYPVVMALGAVLAVCVLVISAQAILICRWRKCKHYGARFTQDEQDVMENSHNQNRDAVELSYAAIHFSKRETKRRKEKQERFDSSLYSEVKNSAVTK